MRGSRRLGMAAMSLMVLAPSCGSGDPASTAGPSLARYADAANALCRDTEQREAVLGSPPQLSQATAADLAPARAYLDRYLPVISDAVARLRGLAAPPGRAAEVGSLLQRLDASVSGFRAAAAAAGAGDPQGFRTAFDRAVQADEDASVIDEQLGLTRCVQLATQTFRRDLRG